MKMQMKRSLQLGALVAVLAVAATSGSRPAWAYPLCDTMNGTTCSPSGSTAPCTTVDGFTSSCKCRTGHWSCLL
jgi:hypothetical protein